MDLDEEELRTTRKKKKLEKDDLTTVYLNGFYDGEEKWKKKIKEKIKKITTINNDFDRYAKLILKEILEEDNHG